MTPTREDLVSAVRAAFPNSDLSTILAILDLYGTEVHEREHGRVKLAIVALSGGNEDKLLHFVARAKEDYRDVLFWTETRAIADVDREKEKLATQRLLDT